MKLKLPSLQILWASVQKVIVRFPLQVLTALAAAIAGCCLVDLKEQKSVEDALVKFVAVSNLALTLLLAVDLYAGVNQLTVTKKWLLRLLAVLICTGLYLLLEPSFYQADIYRIALIAFAFHLLIAFAPFIGKGTLNGFWQFNKSLFLRFLTSALYAAVLFAGLAIALAAIDGLFNANIGWHIYMRLFVLATAGFMTIFFLAGVPENFESINQENTYPKGLKIFTQYVLIPLMTVYLVILLVYEVKIILNWELPKGLVSTLILGYAVFGILSLLLVYPIKEQEGNGWIKLFSKFFYLMMIPLVVLLLLAVWKRVGHYGITESRYILIILAVWLSSITVYFLSSKKQNIKVIPISLCILALLAVYGPQSAFSVSKYSQIARLKKLMASKEQRDIKQRAEVIDYLVDRHGLQSLQYFTKADLSALEDRMDHKVTTRSRYNIKNDKIDTAYALLKINKEHHFDESIAFVPEGDEAADIKGYDFIIPVDSYATLTESRINGIAVAIHKGEQPGDLSVKIGDGPEVTFDVYQLIKDVIAQFKRGGLKESPRGNNTYYLSKKMLTLTSTFNHYETKLLISDLRTLQDPGDKVKLKSWLNYKGYLLIRLK